MDAAPPVRAAEVALRSAGEPRAPEPATAELSVVIPCLNVAGILPRQLDALAQQQWSGSWEVIIADNGSTDETRSVALAYRDRLPALRIVDASDRRGRQHACNAGGFAAGEAMVFVDADDEIAPGYLAALAEALADHDIVAARFDHATLNEGWVHEGRGAGQTTELLPGLGFMPFGGGGTLGVRSSVFRELGGFADDMDFAEDVDFCWRAQLAGHAIQFVPDAVLRYSYRPSLRAMYRQHRNFGRGSARLYRAYRDRGMPRRDAGAWLREWGVLAKGLVTMRTRAQAAGWSRRLGRCVGRLQGSVRYRVWYP
jgi:glycosyltransferase involved in cell wall biosynthesis